MLPEWHFGEHGGRRELMLFNYGDQEIPAFGACEIVDVERPESSGGLTPGGGRTRYKVKRPTADSIDPAKVVFNGPAAIPVGDERVGFHEWPTYSLYDDADTPSVGESWGTQTDSFELKQGNAGFVIWGDAHDGIVMVTREGASNQLQPLQIDKDSPSDDDFERVTPTACIYSATLLSNAADPEGYCAEPSVEGVQVWLYNAANPDPGYLLGASVHYARDTGRTHTVGEDERPLYEVIWAEGAEEIVRFQITANKSFGANVTGRLVRWNGAAYEQFGDTVGLCDSLGVFGPVSSASGASGFAKRFSDRRTVTIESVDYDAYEILYMEDPARWIRFTLLEPMGYSASGYAQASVDDYWGNPSNGISPGSVLNVYDEDGVYPDAKIGAKGMAVFDETENRYVILRVQQPAEAIEGTLYGVLTKEDAGKTINVTFWARGQNPITLFGNPVSVVNPPSGLNGGFVFEGEAGSTVRAEWYGDHYRIVWIECPNTSPVEQPDSPGGGGDSGGDSPGNDSYSGDGFNSESDAAQELELINTYYST